MEYIAGWDQAEIDNFVKSDRVVEGFLNLRNSENAELLFNQSSDLPHLSSIDKSENRMLPIMKVLIALSGGESLGIEDHVKNRDFDGHTTLKIPQSDSFYSGLKLRELSKQKRK